jgi:hypothetical protein
MNIINSEWKTVKFGVPQGSVLGPMLFNVYINDFPGILKNIARTVFYADDTTILVMSNDLFTLNKKLNRVMNMVYSWFRNNNLVLKLSKSHLIKFVTPKSPEYTLLVIYNNFRLKVVDNVKFLGMELDCQLNWKQYAEKLLEKLNIACFMIRKLQALVSEQILRMICFSYCQSQLEYSIIFWGSCLVMKTLFLTQKKGDQVFAKTGSQRFV